jgi:hypothetical protein
MSPSFGSRSREVAIENLSGVQIDFLLFLQSSKFIYQSTRLSYKPLYKTPSRAASSFFVPSGFRSSRCREFLVFKFSRLVGATFSAFEVKVLAKSPISARFLHRRAQRIISAAFSFSVTSAEYAPYQRPPCVHPFIGGYVSRFATIRKHKCQQEEKSEEDQFKMVSKISKREARNQFVRKLATNYPAGSSPTMQKTD